MLVCVPNNCFCGDILAEFQPRLLRFITHTHTKMRSHTIHTAAGCLATYSRCRLPRLRQHNARQFFDKLWQNALELCRCRCCHRINGALRLLVMMMFVVHHHQSGHIVIVVVGVRVAVLVRMTVSMTVSIVAAAVAVRMFVAGCALRLC